MGVVSFTCHLPITTGPSLGRGGRGGDRLDFIGLGRSGQYILVRGPLPVYQSLPDITLKIQNKIDTVF